MQSICAPEKIFADVLGLEASKVGIKNNFFSMGGNSIAAIKVVNKINNFLISEQRSFNKLLVADMFKLGNIENIFDNHFAQNEDIMEENEYVF